MTKEQVIVMAIEGRIRWLDAADILSMTPRHMLRLRRRFEEFGYDGVRDCRGGLPRRKRIPLETIRELCRLRREKYPDFSVQHFWEFATEKHGLQIGYTWAKGVLQAAGLAEKAPVRGKYRRRRERRAMRGMLLHLDASTHAWIPELPKWDLVVMLDDADTRILYARFVEQEGTVSTLDALKYVLERYGRFCELYTDRGSHFCTTRLRDQGPEVTQEGQVARVLEVLGIRHILARSPQARGRSERAFGTIQGRLPKELKAAGITTYEQANVYLETIFVPDFNRRFTVEPARPESAFTVLPGVDLSLLVSVQEQRKVDNDSAVSFHGLVLQLPPTNERPHYVRCPVTVHRFLDGNLGVSYQGRLLAKYTSAGVLLASPTKRPHNQKQPQRAVETDGLGKSADAFPQALDSPQTAYPQSPQPRRRRSASPITETGKSHGAGTHQPSGHL